tara:strand:- start:4128 stop:6611 length:2484 start_codon:yes stop_codon:yes gene_type:complete
MIKEYIQKHFEKKLESSSGLVIYDPNLFYKEIVNSLKNKNIQVFDASENVITARENALEYWVNVMPKNKDAKIVVFVPFKSKQNADDLTFDPFIIFSSGGRVFPDEAADEYKQLCIAALPDKESKIEEFFKEEEYPSFDSIDALEGGNTYPKLKSGLNASSSTEILIAILVPSSSQLDFLKSDKTWIKDLKAFSKNVLGVTLKKQKFDAVSEELWNLVLYSEFVHDLPVELPKQLKDVPVTQSSTSQLIQEVCSQLRKRKDVEEIYVKQANRVSDGLSLPKLFSKETNLGSINTFAFEDTTFFNAFKEQLISGDLKAAESTLNQSIDSIWSTYDDERRSSWLIGRKALSIKRLTMSLGDKSKNYTDINSIVKWYATEVYQLDTLHRELDKNVAELISISKLLKEVHTFAVDAYLNFIESLQKTFLECVEKDGLSSLSIQRNIDLFDKRVEPFLKSGKKTVYFLADALRYELASQLKSRLERASFDAEIEPSLAFSPTVTKYAMAALMPKADANLSLKLKGKKLEPFLSDVESASRDARMKYSLNILGDKASWAWEKDILSDKYEKTDLLFVTTTEIDQAGESSPDNAQLMIEQALKKILKVSSKLKDEGYEEFVLAADHGFVLLNEFKVGNKSEKPIGEWSLQKSRCLAGKGASNSDHIELSATDLGVNSEVDQFLFLKNYATYERGKQFFHEGISLQEIITPCLTYRPQKSKEKEEVQINLTYKGKDSGVITTLRPSLELATFGQTLFGDVIDVQIEAVSKEKVVGRPSPSESVNSTTGYLEIEEGASMKFSLAMDEDFEGDFIVYAKSPATGLILSELKLTTEYM